MSKRQRIIIWIGIVIFNLFAIRAHIACDPPKHFDRRAQQMPNFTSDKLSVIRTQFAMKSFMIISITAGLIISLPHKKDD